MTQGEENKAPYIHDVLPKIVASKAVVCTLALGVTAGNKLETIATKTHGKAFNISDFRGNVPLQLKTAFFSSTTHAQTTAPTQTLLDAEEEFTSSLENKFQVDSAVGNSTVVHVKQKSPSNMRIQASLIDPSGQPCQGCHESANGDETAIAIPSPAMVGTWTLHMTSPTSTPVKVSVRVESEPRTKDEQMLEVSCRGMRQHVNKFDESVILAEIKKGKKVVLDAVVLATVHRPEKNPQAITIALHDDGLDPDVQENDGVYSEYFIDFIGKGIYPVKVEVSNQNATRLDYPFSDSDSSITTSMLQDTMGADAGTSWDPESDFPEFQYEYPLEMFEIVEFPEDPPSPTAETMEDFQRAASCGHLNVTKDITIKQVPPGKILDFAVKDVRPGKRNSCLVQLTWTWPGAHIKSGKASALEIRAAKESMDLTYDFENQVEITEANVAEGNLDPKPPGDQHNVTLSLPTTFSSLRQDGEFNCQAFVGARVVNTDGLKSRTNVVPVFYYPRPVTTTKAATTKATTTRAPTSKVTTTQAEGAAKESIQGSDLVASPFFWVAVCCIAAAIVIVIAVAVSAILNREEVEES
ncbi:calcium-activated chloride channel regulator 1-like [Amblyomma americanum]